MPSNEETLSILIPTNSRPQCLQRCLSSIYKYVTAPFEIIVLNSTSNDCPVDIKKRYKLLFEKYADISLISFDKNIPPGKARSLLAKKASHKYLLFLDDDIILKPKSVSNMLNLLLTEKADIVSGIWIEHNKSRPAGYLYTNAHKGNTNFVVKQSILPQDIPANTCVYFDDVQATLMTNREIFKKVDFDHRYSFYYELFDFFMQCKQHKIKIACHTGAFFTHKPEIYTANNTLHHKNQEEDKMRFVEKWKAFPVFSPNPFSRKKKSRKINRLFNKIYSRLIYPGQ